jgi:hypothetical protein
MTKHHTATPAQALDDALQTAESAAMRLADWIGQHVAGLPPGAFFYVTLGNFFTEWRLELCQGTERRELDAARLIDALQTAGQLTAAELREYEL